MADLEPTDRLAHRLERLRELGDRHRAQHPVSVLRNDLAAAADATESTDLEAIALPSLEQRTHALARRLFSPIVARGEQLAETILDDACHVLGVTTVPDDMARSPMPRCPDRTDPD